LGEHLNLWYNYQICPLWREYNIFPTIFRPNRIIPFHFLHSFGPFHFLLSILRLFTFFIPFYNIFTPNPLFSFLSPSNPFKPQQRPSRQNQKKRRRERFCAGGFFPFWLFRKCCFAQRTKNHRNKEKKPKWGQQIINKNWRRLQIQSNMGKMMKMTMTA
jgi:hypothetical protein